MAFESAFKAKLIYVFRISDEAHRGCLKVGETTLKGNGVSLEQIMNPNNSLLNKAAKDRIDQYTSTAGIQYELLHTEFTLCLKDGVLKSFNDGEVHKILRRSGIKQKFFGTDKKANEWFVTDLETVKNAIKAAKEGRESLNLFEVSTDRNPIEFRPEQRDAINRTKKRFKTNNQYLWNAKMRFGKTLSALQVVKEMEFDRTLILTHRPVVNAGWFEDFGKIFYDRDDYQYGSKDNGATFSDLERQYQQSKHFVYFASMQDLRGSERVGGNFDKNNEIFGVDWNLLIVDEAHEGTKTELGQAVLNELIKENTKVLQLSGTPFNLLDDYKEEEIYTWDYVMEQRAKKEWDETHWGDPNPYACLPKLNIYTYDLSLELRNKYQDEEHAFNFAEFFRVGNDGKFLHDGDVDNFLNLLTRANDYPYSKKEWRDNFKHTIWTVPSVAAAKALSEKIRNHNILGAFTVVNVAGDGDLDADFESDNALEMVQQAIKENEYTITLTRGRLTTGVSVPEWTAVFMLHGSSKTSAAGYMQTIFRAQTPAVIGGMQKTECYVFDFAPDRTLKVLAETAKVSSKAGKTTETDRNILGEFLNFCPVISFQGSQMSAVNVDHMMQKLKRVYVERVVNNGFEDTYLYNDKLLQLSQIELEKFAGLRKIVGQTKAMKSSNEVDVNTQGFTSEEYEKIKEIEKKQKKRQPLTIEEARLLEEKEAKKKQRDVAISILRGISIRMPMMLYGADIQNEDKEITIDNFTAMIDDLSWTEFMPKDVTKELFNDFKQYYDGDIFTAAGRRIRELARCADAMDVESRIEQITNIFSSFRNPDKETVLTPWRVVNMHLGDTLGGWNFLLPDQTTGLNAHYVSQGDVTRNVFRKDARILEINSKSGLYPLYIAYSIYRNRLEAERMQHLIAETDETERLELHKKLWDEVLKNNVFVLCKTPMAKNITRRTLAGFRAVKVNAHYFEDLINQITNKKEQFINRVTKGNYWNQNTITNMNFDAIVGNPPYQVMDGGAQASATPVYNRFVETAKKLEPKYISMIMPSRWMTGGKGLDDFRKAMINDKQLKAIHDFPNASDCFPTVEIKGGVNYFLWEKNNSDDCLIFTHSGNKVISEAKRPLVEHGCDVFIRNNELVSIFKKVSAFGEQSFSKIVSPRKPYGLSGDFFKDPSKYSLPPISTDSIENGLTIYGLDESLKRIKRYISKNYPLPRKDYVDGYKMFMARNQGSGLLGETFSVPVFAKPNECCTETFVVVGTFETQKEMNDCWKYMTSKFFRAMVGIKKNDQGMAQGVYKYVPLQDFTSKSDIDWSKSVAEIDKQLYKKYNLSDEEIGFIEQMIKPME